MAPLRLSYRCLRTGFLVTLSLACSSVSSATNGCPTFAFAALQPATLPTLAASELERVNFAMQSGLLQPQLEQLLQQQFATEVVDWQVSPHFRWPADYSLQAPSWHQLLERLLKPYQLAVTLYPNKSATVRYAAAAVGAGL